MVFHLVTLFPESFVSYLDQSIMKMAQEKWAFSVRLWNLADYSSKNTRRADDRPYGGLPGTVLAPEPLHAVITAIEAEAGKTLDKIVLAPRGETLSQPTVEKLANPERDYIVICGHYEWIDQRIIDYHRVREISIGEYVLSSGELAAMVLIDSIVRLLPWVVKDRSLAEESYSESLGRKREYPHYTRPETFLWMSVPPELLSGNPKIVQEWKNRHLS